MAITDLIRESSRRISKSRREWVIFDRIHVWIRDPFTSDITPEDVFSELERRIPARLTSNIDGIFVGDFEELTQREISALYQNGTIYITNDQNSNQDFLEDLIHEIAHASEEYFQEEVYSDYQLADEFLGKRRRLLSTLKAIGYDVNENMFLSLEFIPELDEFLYQELGYEKLAHIASGLFLSPYAATSIREYWADGFEDYYLKGHRSEIMNTCPVLFSKLEEIDVLANEY